MKFPLQISRLPERVSFCLQFPCYWSCVLPKLKSKTFHLDMCAVIPRICLTTNPAVCLAFCGLSVSCLSCCMLGYLNPYVPPNLYLPKCRPRVRFCLCPVHSGFVYVFRFIPTTRIDQVTALRKTKTNILKIIFASETTNKQAICS